MTDSFVSSGGFGCSAPIPFQKHLKITTEKTVGFYNIYYQLYKDVKLKSWTPQSGLLIADTALGAMWQRSQTGQRTSERTSSTRHPGDSQREAMFPNRKLVRLDHPGTIQFIKINPLFRPIATASITPICASTTTAQKRLRSTCRSGHSSDPGWVKRTCAACSSA